MGPTAASTGAWSPRSGSRSTWTTPSSSSWATPLRNCLNRPVSRARAVTKCSGANSGSRGNSTGRVDVERVAHPHVGGVDQGHDVAGVGLVERVALLPEHRVGVLGGERPAGGLVGDHHPPLEPPGAHPHERHPVAVRRVHVGLDLEHERRERVVELAGGAVDVEPGRRRRRQVDDAVEQQADPEVGERRADEHRRLLARQEQLDVDRRRPARRAAPASSAAVRQASPSLGLGLARGRRTSSVASAGAVGGAPVADELPGAPVDQPPEVAGDSRPAT